MDGLASIDRRQAVSRYALLAPTFVASLAVTELFFKFGSFTLELAGFAALWGGLYGAQALVGRALKK